MTGQRRLLTSAELARALNISVRSVQRYRAEGVLKPADVTIGGQARWDLDDVREQIRALREPLDEDGPGAP